MGVTALDDLMTIDDAVGRWPTLFRRDELMSAAREARLRHIRKGRRRLVTEEWLRDWLEGKAVGPWDEGGAHRKDASSSEDTGSGRSPDDRTGSATGMTPEQEESAADLLAQKHLKRPRRSSPATS